MLNQPFKVFSATVSKKIEMTTWYKIAFSLNGLIDKILNNEGGFTTKTQAIKLALSKLGHECEKRVYTNRLLPEQVEEINKHLEEIGKYDQETNGFKNTEWLYDVHWYTDVGGKFYTPRTLDLVCECEWKKVRDFPNKKMSERQEEERKLSAIKFDFQKLLTSNALLRLLICRLSDLKEIDYLKDYIHQAVCNNKQIAHNSKFLIICYVKKEGKMYYLNTFKKNKAICNDLLNKAT